MPGAVVIAAFWVIVVLLFVNYYGLYLFLRLLPGRDRNNPPRLPDGDLPSLSVFVPAHNEERVIARKIENLREQDYPKDKLTIVIASDCSTDATNDIVRRYFGEGVELREFTRRSGKLGMIDSVIPTLPGEVAVVTDANVMLASDALRRMAEHYADPEVGATCGNQSLIAPQEGVNYEPEMRYHAAETRLKREMGKWGLVIGVWGGFYSIRRDCFRPIGRLPGEDDLILPMEALAQGYRANFAEAARAWEEAVPRLTGIFRRRVRLTTYNLNTVRRLIAMALRAGLGATLLTAVYKLLRWLSPYLAILLAIATALLLHRSPVYLGAGVAIAAVILAAAIGWLLDALGRRAPGFSAAFQFMMMNVAAYVGFFYWLRGVKGYWNPRG